MEFVSHHGELGWATLMFARPFSNIQIERIDKKGNSSWLHVQCVNAQRSRIFKALENPERKAQYKLPLIAYSRTGFQRVTDRLNNLHNEVKWQVTDTRRNYNFLTPVPVDISFDVVVMAKYQADIDKIAQNFMVFFNNDIYASCEHPLYEGLKLHNQIVMGDSVSEDHPDEIDGTQDDIITATFNFTFKTYLFAGTQRYRKRKMMTQTYLSSVVSSYVFQFKTEDEVLEYLSAHPVSNISATLTSEAYVEVTSLVSSETSSEYETYDDGIPIVHSLDFGYYDVPQREDFEAWMASVDNELFQEHVHEYPSAYISSLSYEGISGYYSDDEGNLCCKLSVLNGVGDYYRPVDGFCSYAPFVDRVRWEIDLDSMKSFPDNFKSYSEIADQR